MISVAVHRRARRPRRAGAGTTDWAQTSHCVIANPVRTLGVAISCRNYPLPTNSFMPTACRFADGTPSRRALRSAYEAVLESFSFSSVVGANVPVRPCRNYRPHTNLFCKNKYLRGNPAGIYFWCIMSALQTRAALARNLGKDFFFAACRQNVGAVKLADLNVQSLKSLQQT